MSPPESKKVWVRGHYRIMRQKTPDGKLIRKWVDGYWKTHIPWSRKKKVKGSGLSGKREEAA